MGDAHALAAAARGGLDHDGIADLVGDEGCVFGRFDHAEIAGDGRHLSGVGEFLRFDLVAHRFDGARVRADEDDSRLAERPRESRALGEEAVAGMHRLRARLLGGGDDLLDYEIGLGRRGRSDRDRLVGHFHVKRVLVGLGINRDRRDPHPVRGPDDPARDLAAIGDQNLLEHRPPAEGGFGSIGDARARLRERAGPPTRSFGQRKCRRARRRPCSSSAVISRRARAARAGRRRHLFALSTKAPLEDIHGVTCILGGRPCKSRVGETV